jgi:DNA-binding PadR family transcriptional regulator
MPISTDNTIVRDVFTSFVRIHVLHHAAKEPIFGVEMIAELSRHGYTLSPGTLYPILHGLEESGLLTASSKVVDGKMRKYYKGTAKGRRVLAQVKEKIRELIGEVLEE